jgi:hypothetical protein
LKGKKKEQENKRKNRRTEGRKEAGVGREGRRREAKKVQGKTNRLLSFHYAFYIWHISHCSLIKAARPE